MVKQLVNVTLRAAQEALIGADLEAAVRLQAAYLAANPNLAELLGINLVLARRRWRKTRHDMKPKVLICGYHLSPASATRVRGLADLWKPLAEIGIIDASLSCWDGALLAPAFDTRIPCHIVPVAKEIRFAQKALELVLAHPCDLLHLSNPRVASVLFGILYKLFWDAQVIVDIDDESFGSVSTGEPLAHESLSQTQGDWPHWLRSEEEPVCQSWAQAAAGLWDVFDGATVSNPLLQLRYKGLLLPYARSVAGFTPSVERRQINRARLRIPQDRTVVLLFGVPSLLSCLAEAANSMTVPARRNLCFLLLGNFPASELREEFTAMRTLDIRFLPDQLCDDDVLAAADICLLLQSGAHPPSGFQLRAKVVDALAMGLLVLAQPAPVLEDLVRAGVVAVISVDTWASSLARWIDDPTALRVARSRGQAYFLAKLETEQFSANVANLLAARRTLPATRILLERPIQRRLFELLGGWQMFAGQQWPTSVIRPARPGGRQSTATAETPTNGQRRTREEARGTRLAEACTCVRSDKGEDALRILSRLAGDGTADDHDMTMRLFDKALRQVVAARMPNVPSTMVELGLSGIKALRSGKPEAALPHWESYWHFAGTLGKCPEHLRFRWYENFNTKRFTEASLLDSPSNATGLPPRIVVYTALFGDYDALRAPLFRPAGIDFVCFSDRPRRAPGWDVQVVTGTPADPVTANRFFKMLPHRHFPEHFGSYYIDANILVTGDMGRLFRRWFGVRPFVAWRHPNRSDVQDEIEAILTNLRAEPESILALAGFLRDAGIPEHIGMLEAALLWRRHDDLPIQGLMEQWWQLFQHYPSRDQPTLSYAMWVTGTRPLILPDVLGSTRENDFTVKLSHRQTRLWPSARPARGGAMAASDTGTAPAPPPRRGNLTWVYWDQLRSRGSTLMRGRQLSDIARARIDIPVGYVHQTEVAMVSGSILILTKSYLQQARIADLQALRERGNVICADYVDEPPRVELDELIDIFISSSIRQHIHFCNQYPDKPTHMITHHADARIANIRPPSDRLRVSYFGELMNARHRDSLAGQVVFNPVDTKNVQCGDAGWIDQLSLANMHYAVREQREIDGFKPFLKGFTAAVCGSNIIVPQQEGDARYYLGSDYPYILPNDQLETIRQMIEFARESFGQDEWRTGLEIMRDVASRCSTNQIVRELRDLLVLAGQAGP